MVVQIRYCQGCGSQCFSRSVDWREETASDKYCHKPECQKLAAKPVYDPHTRNGRLAWANPPVYDPMREATKELARMEKRLALALKEEVN